MVFDHINEKSASVTFCTTKHIDEASFSEFYRTYSEYLLTVYKPANPLSLIDITPIDSTCPYAKYDIENPFEGDYISSRFTAHFYIKPTVENFIHYLRFMQIVPMLNSCNDGYSQLPYTTSIQLEPKVSDWGYDAYQKHSMEFYERDSQTWLRVNDYIPLDETTLTDYESIWNELLSRLADLREDCEEYYLDDYYGKYHEVLMYVRITDDCQYINTYTDINLSTFDYSKIGSLYRLIS